VASNDELPHKILTHVAVCPFVELFNLYARIYTCMCMHVDMHVCMDMYVVVYAVYKCMKNGWLCIVLHVDI